MRALCAAGIREQRLALYLAWHAAAFQRADRLPDLRELLDRVSAAVEDGQDPKEQLAAARAIAAAFQGLPE